MRQLKGLIRMVKGGGERSGVCLTCSPGRGKARSRSGGNEGGRKDGGTGWVMEEEKKRVATRDVGAKGSAKLNRPCLSADVVGLRANAGRVRVYWYAGWNYYGETSTKAPRYPSSSFGDARRIRA